MTTHKSPNIAKLIGHIRHDRYDPHYLGYFECLNKQMYYEAHDVLEELWLENKGDRLHPFYKGLIQVAGGFVHLKKNKLNPAARLFRLSKKYLEPFRPVTEGLDVRELLGRIDGWLEVLESSNYKASPYDQDHPPLIRLKVTL